MQSISVLIASYAAAAGSLGWFLIELLRGGIPWTPAFLASLGVLWVLAARNPGRLWKDHPAAAVFWTCLAVYLSTFRWHGGDDAPNSLIPFCLLRYKTLLLDPVIEPWFAGKADFYLRYRGHFLSVYPITAGLMAVPLYILPIAAGVVPSEQFLHNLSKLSGSLITAASVAVFYRAASKRCSREWALCLSALYGLGSWAFSVSSQALWQHGPAQLGVALGLWGLTERGQLQEEKRSSFPQSVSGNPILDPRLRGDKRRLFRRSLLSGFGFALAVAARPDTIFFAAAAGLFVLFHRTRRLLGFAAGALPSALFLAWYWWHYTGRLRPPEAEFQAAMFTGFQWSASLGIIFSPTRGLLFFFPAALFGVWAALRGVLKGAFQRPIQNSSPLMEEKQGGGKALSFWLLLACAGPWLLISCYTNWVGGETFGTRYFAVVALVLTYFCADVDFEKKIRSSRRLLTAWSATVSACILIHALGGYLNWPGSQAIFEEKATLWRWSLHPVAQLFAADGPLALLGMPGRWAAGLLVLGVFGFAAKWGRAGLRRAQMNMCKIEYT